MNIIRKNFTSVFKTLSYQMSQVKVQNKIGYIYFNSPKDFNALSHEMRQSLIKNIQNLQQSSDVKVIVLLSKVKKAFCAGANIKQFAGKTTKDFINNDIFEQLHNVVYGAKKPIIAGVNGVALGGGFQLALLCDMIYCSEEARFALPQLKLGLIPGIGGTQRLARLVGKTNAMHYILTSQMISANRAKQIGIVSEVFKTDQLHQKVTAIANEITNKPLPAILAAKQCIKQSQNVSMNDGVALQRKLFYPLYDTQGMKQGVNAFIEKRPANMKNL